MRDPLEAFIGEHRQQLDIHQPSPELWTKIESTMTIAPTIPAKPVSWLKYFTFGTSVLILAIAVYKYMPAGEKAAVLPADPSPGRPSAQPAAVTATSNETAYDGKNETPPVPFLSVNRMQDTATEDEKYASCMPGQSWDESEEETMPEAVPAGGNGEERRSDEKITTKVDTSFNGITRLEINSGSADIHIVAQPSSGLSVKGSLDESNKYKVNFRRSDTVLYVTVSMEGCGTKNKVVFFSKTTTTRENRLDFLVPENINLLVNSQFGDADVTGTKGKVCRLRISSGSLKANDIGNGLDAVTTYGDLQANNIGGNLLARVSSGSVKLNDVAGSVDLVGSYGDLKARNIGGSLTAKISSGSADIGKVGGNVNLITTYGDQVIGKLSGNLVTNASSGSVSLSDATGAIDIKATYGDVSMRGCKGTIAVHVSSGGITGSNVELTGNSSLVSSYGDIHMKLVNPLDALKLDLHSTYGEITINKDGYKASKDDLLQYGSGNILLKAVSSSGSQLIQ